MMYKDTPVNQTYRIAVDETHMLYVEECGNPDGQPVVFLHGGPGGAISENSRRFFDPQYYRIILFDQRGTGQSTPFLCLENNTVLDSVADMEVIREYLDIKAWYIFGGSYGSTLALAYAIHHPERVQHLILRGIFLGRQSDVDWLFQEGAGYFYPEAFEQFKQWIPENEQSDLVQAYYCRMTSDDEVVREKAYLKWNQWESAIVRLVPDEASIPISISKGDRSIGLLEAHYFANKMFWNEDNYLLNRADKLQSIPMDIVHGRYDIDCRPLGAYELKKACPQANLQLIALGGHTPFEDAMFKALCQVMEQLKHEK
ncbi:prolyl aminopeptidase [Aerococcaceae bacterium zg-BR22]|uniref:prolyl aminopeptidase n=1 Tax=Aerococcaceae bacterium zg-1292 TaxID=2774330 RepID=UPI004064AF57|nr:prolyl aminopeptidase [Aerococcaceae bacterium zg-BR22]